MKVLPHCRDCLKGLARQVVTLSEGSEGLLGSSLRLVDTLFDPEASPTRISNRLLKYVREETGALDPFAHRKAVEFEKALKASERLAGSFNDTLDGALRSAAFGNGGDFFLDPTFDFDGFDFSGDLDKIEKHLCTSSTVLILGDNMGDFIFDLPLMGLFERMGKRVLYAVKECPVQNDMSVVDVARFGADKMWQAFISTGTDEVGIRREDMSGTVLDCWQNGCIIVAKGMGNYETISEYDRERPVVHVMKVKCESVAAALGKRVGEYTAILGGENHG
jgi:damage-control phosphatase, subfamily I